MNATLFNADRHTHLKIVAAGLLGAIVVVWIAIAAHLGAEGIARVGSDVQVASSAVPITPQQESSVIR